MMRRRCAIRPVAVAVLLVLMPAGFGSAPPTESPSTSRPATTAPDEAAPRPAPPRSDERKDERHRMVEEQIRARGIRDTAVLDALNNVPRHWFVPEAVQPYAYEDRPLPIGEGQTISQPYIVAFMTEALKLTPESKVLEVGTGSGYQAAVLAEITPQVYTIEIVEPLARQARETFARRGYRTIVTRTGDGYAGWPEEAPFDAIIVTCAPDAVPPALIRQLKPGGRLCLPVGPTGRQNLVRVTKRPDGTTRTEDLLPVAFVPMTGEARPPRGPRGPD
jgi:protein-L-isoaspartate(D-aspartate) O-methyltransferase